MRTCCPCPDQAGLHTGDGTSPAPDRASASPPAAAARSHHLPEAIAALELKLTGDEIAALEKPYSNHGPSWY